MARPTDGQIKLLRRLVAGEILNVTFLPVHEQCPKCRHVWEKRVETSAWWEEESRCPHGSMVLALYQADMIDLNEDGEAFVTELGADAARMLTWPEKQARKKEMRGKVRAINRR
jgi:hypothetical protein